MNARRGPLRTWLVLSILWLLGVAFMAHRYHEQAQEAAANYIPDDQLADALATSKRNGDAAAVIVLELQQAKRQILPAQRPPPPDYTPYVEAAVAVPLVLFVLGAGWLWVRAGFRADKT